MEYADSGGSRRSSRVTSVTRSRRKAGSEAVENSSGGGFALHGLEQHGDDWEDTEQSDLNIRVKERGDNEPPPIARRGRIGGLFKETPASGIINLFETNTAGDLKETIKRPLTGLFRKPGSRSGGRPSVTGSRREEDLEGPMPPTANVTEVRSISPDMKGQARASPGRSSFRPVEYEAVAAAPHLRPSELHGLLQIDALGAKYPNLVKMDDIDISLLSRFICTEEETRDEDQDNSVWPRMSLSMESTRASKSVDAREVEGLPGVELGRGRLREGGAFWKRDSTRAAIWPVAEGDDEPDILPIKETPASGIINLFETNTAGDLKETIKRPLTGLFRKPGSRSGGRPSVTGSRREEDLEGPMPPTANVTEVRSISPDMKGQARASPGRSSFRPVEYEAVAAAPHLRPSELHGLLQIDALCAKYPNLVKMDDIDISLLSRFICTEEETRDEDQAWTWDTIFAAVSSEMREEWAMEESLDEDEEKKGHEQPRCINAGLMR